MDSALKHQPTGKIIRSASAAHGAASAKPCRGDARTQVLTPEQVRNILAHTSHHETTQSIAPLGAGAPLNESLPSSSNVESVMIRNSAPTRAQKWNAFFIAFAIVISYFAVMGAYSWGPSFLPATATVTMEEEGSHRTESLFSKVMWFYTRERPTPREAILKEPIEWRIAPEDSAQPAVSQSSFDAPAYPNRMSLLTKVFRIIRQHAPKNKNAHALAEAIVREAERQGYDPLFVAAVIKSESTFNSFAKSNKGAQGLMQLMPKTSRWLAQKHDLPKGKLTDPGYNLQLGVRYLKHLETDLYGGDKVFTLIAYNWGPGHVESAADGKRRVPPEVMTYSVKILNDYRRWKADLMSGAL